MAFIPVLCCSSQMPGPYRGVPGDAIAASEQVHAATSAALASGRRTMLVDILVQTVRREARTFDSQVFGSIVAGLCRSLSPALSSQAPSIKLCLPGTRAALDIQQYFAIVSEAANAIAKEDPTIELPPPLVLPNVEIETLGAGTVSDENGALVIVDPPGRGQAIDDFRCLVRDATAKRKPVLVMNHPQPGSVHEIAGCKGELPYELVDFVHVFTLAPFAMRVKSGQKAGSGAGRFILKHAFPGNWELWRMNTEKPSSGGTPDTVSQLLSLASPRRSEPPDVSEKPPGFDDIDSSSVGDEPSYELCAKWRERPSEEALLRAVKRATIEAG